MPTTVLVERRNYFRLPVAVPAALYAPLTRVPMPGTILDLSESGIGFTADCNLHAFDELRVSFWLPFDVAHPNAATLQPVLAHVTLVSSRYSVDFATYAYSAVFVGLNPQSRHDIRTFIAGITKA